MDNKSRAKKKIVVFIDWFLPAYKAGGPVQSVYNLVQHLSNDFDFHIVTSDRDLGDNSSFENVLFNEWIDNDVFKVIYLSVENQTKSNYQKILSDINPGLVYINSLFSIPFALKPLLAGVNYKCQIIVAPRGMLGAGALQLKATKKKVFLAVFKLFGLHKKIVFHATAPEEAQEIKLQFGEKIALKIASNLPSKSPLYSPKTKKENELSVFFLSRIHQKKNLLLAIQLLKQVSKDIAINFTIIGPIDGQEYWELCTNEMDDFDSNITCNYLGSVPHSELSQILEHQHLLFLPTMNENYGHSIVESWQNSCPVLISDQTPWRNLPIQNIGWDLSLENPTQFVETIEKIAKMDQVEYDILSQSSFEFAKSFANDPKLIESSRILFE